MKYTMANAPEHPSGGAPVGTDASSVVLRIPGSADFLRLARYAAADAAARAGLGLDGVDDVRLAVSELCSLMAGPHLTIELTFVAGASGVEVMGSGSLGEQHGGENGELARTLVAAVVDEFHFDVDGDRARFRIVKRQER
jgi:hypothetical protein